MREIDLHVHTDISDGSETPENTVKHAKSLGLRAIAITDHDSINGVERAQAAGAELGLEVAAGMELGCGWYGREVHMLGYDLDVKSPKLPPVLEWVVNDRDQRNRKMVDMLARDGLCIDLDELQEKHPGSTIGRPHFALCLVEAGLAESVKDAFSRYLDPDCKYYIRRHFLSLEEAAELIISAGGIPVIAHPRQYRLSQESFTELMERSAKCGVRGLECYYSGYGPETVAEYLAAAEKYGFCPTAGSDWHGAHKPHIELGFGMSGELCAPYTLLERLRGNTKQME